MKKIGSKINDELLHILQNTNVLKTNRIDIIDQKTFFYNVL